MSMAILAIINLGSLTQIPWARAHGFSGLLTLTNYVIINVCFSQPLSFGVVSYTEKGKESKKKNQWFLSPQHLALSLEHRCCYGLVWSECISYLVLSVLVLRLKDL
jgi:hypothetical protein